MEKVNIVEKFEQVKDYWNPKIAGELNGQYVKFAKLKGEFIYHKHDEEDEMFLVIKGRLIMKMMDREVVINEGEFIIIPKGVEHKPVALEEVHVLLFEPVSTLNTGDKTNELTRSLLEHI